jgi:glycine dehydrogenase subunit 2
LKPYFVAPHRELVKHEFVLSASRLKKERGVRTMDIAKRLLDHDMHAPTVYFPLVVDEALMIEPTESEPLAELERFVDVMVKIVEEDPQTVTSAPHKTPVGRLDEAWAARKRVLSWQEAARRIDEVAPESTTAE